MCLETTQGVKDLNNPSCRSCKHKLKNKTKKLLRGLVRYKNSLLIVLAPTVLSTGFTWYALFC